MPDFHISHYPFLLKKGFEYSQITETIFIGTNMCCTYHFAKELTLRNIRADVSLESERLDRPWGAEFFLWLPTIDHTPSTIEQLHTGADFLHTMNAQNIKTYVHCKNGHGRAPSLVAAYLIKYKSYTAADAIVFIKKNRSVIHLESSQYRALEEFEKLIHS